MACIYNIPQRVKDMVHSHIYVQCNEEDYSLPTKRASLLALCYILDNFDEIRDTLRDSKWKATTTACLEDKHMMQVMMTFLKDHGCIEKNESLAEIIERRTAEEPEKEDFYDIPDGVKDRIYDEMVEMADCNGYTNPHQQDCAAALIQLLDDSDDFRETVSRIGWDKNLFNCTNERDAIFTILEKNGSIKKTRE